MTNAFIMPNWIENFTPVELNAEDFARYVPPLESGGDIKEAGRLYLDRCLVNLKKLNQESRNADFVLGTRALMIDRLITTLFSLFGKEVRHRLSDTGAEATLVAQGGYGRREMSVYSDIDLLFLYPKKRGPYIESLTEKILYVLWDLGLEVGYATRTVDECRKLFLEDVTIMTALLDMRYLCGESLHARELSEKIRKTLRSSSVSRKLVKRKSDERTSRVRRFGDSVFVLEPNIKDSAGGLRDLQLPLWLAKIFGKGSTFRELLSGGLLDPAEYRLLTASRNFLHKVRNELHLLAGKKIDQLTFDRQEALAHRLGFADSDGILAVEKFMQTYYRMASSVTETVDQLSRRLVNERPGIGWALRLFRTKHLDEHFRIVDGQVAVRASAVFEEDPVKMMEVFRLVQEEKIPLHEETKNPLRLLSTRIDESYRNNPEAVVLFRRMLRDYKHLGETLLIMHDVGFFDEWMPEFKKLRCRVQHDIYHIYTVDTHSLFAVNEISRLAEGKYSREFPLYEATLREVKSPELLNLGVILHDIGKGEGGNHSVRGAKIASRITRRLGLNSEEQKTVDFLILSHLMMPHLSQRRDLEAPELIIQFARSVGTIDNLNMLFLLTWADIRAVGPDAWTNWKGMLLERLYQKTREVITRGELSAEKTKERMARVKEELLSLMGNRYSRDDLQHFLSLMPPRYFFAVAAKEVEPHFVVYQRAEKEDVVSEFRPLPDRGMSEVLIYTVNTPQVFSLVTGVMLSHEINIIGADVFFTGDGHLFVILLVTDVRGRPIIEGETFEKIRKSLRSVLAGQTKVEDLIAERRVPEYLMKKPVQKAESKVVIDNDVSPYYTVIDVYAHDRLGLLHDITRTLIQLGCYVEVSKISTKVEQVTDVFYVKDIFGHKITGAEKIAAIKKALFDVIQIGTGPQDHGDALHPH